VTYTDIPALHSTFRMIDTQQIDMAHIGATKLLMQKVDSLYTTLTGIQADISTMSRSL
jgi:hypothetical protein